MSEYVNRFLRLKCAGDVLNIANPINNPEKEISESFAILRRIKPLALANKMQYHVVDLCAGNALTSLMSVFVLPVTGAFAVDNRPRKRNWEAAQRFMYVTNDIYTPLCPEETAIIVSSHPCKHAVRVIEIFNNSKAKALCLIPCCNGVYPKNAFLGQFMDKYDQWTYHLSTLIDSKAKITVVTDHNILSPKNNVIFAVR